MENHPVLKMSIVLRGSVNCSEAEDINYLHVENFLHPSLTLPTQNPKMHSLHVNRNAKHGKFKNT